MRALRMRTVGRRSGNLRLGPAPLGLVVMMLIGLMLASCAPTAQPAPDDPATAAIERSAEVAFHRMEIGRLQTGSYTTNVLVDVELPSGTRWTLLEYPPDGAHYVLQFTSDDVPGLAWRVSPAGVRRVALP